MVSSHTGHKILLHIQHYRDLTCLFAKGIRDLDYVLYIRSREERLLGGQLGWGCLVIYRSSACSTIQPK